MWINICLIANVHVYLSFAMLWHITHDRMLVCYSSSSEEESEDAVPTDENNSFSRKCQEEEDGNNGGPARKKHKIEQQAPKSRCVFVNVSDCRSEISYQIFYLSKTSSAIV